MTSVEVSLVLFVFNKVESKVFGTMGIVVCYLKSLSAFHELQARMRSRLTFRGTLASMATRALMKGICTELFLFFTTLSVSYSFF